MIVIPLVDGVKRVSIANTTRRAVFVDFEKDTKEATRIVLMPRVKRVVDIEGKRYVLITAPPGVDITVIGDK